MYNLAKKICENDKNKDCIIWLAKDNVEKRYKYEELNLNSNKFANLLISLNVKKGDRVVVYAEKIPDVIFAILGILKIGAIYCPIFSSSGIDSLKSKVDDCKPKIIITQENLKSNILFYKERDYIDNIILLKTEKNDLSNNEIEFDIIKDKLSSEFEDYKTEKNDIAMIHYTSGTTSPKPKGVVSTHENMERILYSMKMVFELKEEERFWCTADFAWITGTVYGILGPLGVGATIFLRETQMNNLANIKNILKKYNINIWYTAPTLLRMIMKEQSSNNDLNDFKCLRNIFSVGEHLNKEIISWSERVFGKYIIDTWFQTETGSIMISNLEKLETKKGSMGKPLPDIEIGILDEHNKISEIGQIGKLFIKKNWGSMFVDYWKNHNLYNQKFIDDWYFTGDKAFIDEDGYIWFYTREDDVINTAGHLVNPLELEDIINNMEEIKEVMVLGLEDDLLGQKVKACLVLNENNTEIKIIERKIRSIIRKSISSYAVPQIIEIYNELPKTNSGKIVRSNN